MKVFTYIMMVGALCCLFCYSKEKEDAPTGATFNKTFVTGYLTPESIVISKMNSGIKITFKGDLITSGRSFDALSIYYNDLSYNRYTIDGPRTAINDSIYKIEVYTVENFDASHPAGSDISDLIECRYISYYDYIQSGYKKEDKDVGQYIDMTEYWGIEGAKMLKDELTKINNRNTKLIAPTLVLKFKKEPENKVGTGGRCVPPGSHREKAGTAVVPPYKSHDPESGEIRQTGRPVRYVRDDTRGQRDRQGVGGADHP